MFYVEYVDGCWLGLSRMFWNNFENYRWLIIKYNFAVCTHSSQNYRTPTSIILEIWDIQRHIMNDWYLLNIKISGNQWHERWVNFKKGKDDFNWPFTCITRICTIIIISTTKPSSCFSRCQYLPETFNINTKE